jgi:predicted hydrocarbon binding protein
MTIEVVDGGFKGYHNYYTPDEFFKADAKEGAIYLRDGERAAKVNESFIAGLHLGIEEEVGDSSGLLMYRCGHQWALRDMKRFSNRMRQEYGGGKTDIWQMNKQFVMETWWWPLTVQGFGAWRLTMNKEGNEAFQNKGLTVIELRNSAVAQSMALAGKPVCHMYAGLFAGVFSFYEREERGCIEIQCYAMGNDVCKFLIGSQKHMNAVEFWSKEGATANEILEKLG